MSPSVRSFFKVILSSTLREGKLKLPSKFAKEHWNELSESVRLFIPVGRSWYAGVERDIHKTIWFQDGLLKFLKDNSVGIGYFLIFEYEGSSMFNVLIFDLTATEVSYICNGDSAKCSSLDQVQVPDTGGGVGDECLDPSADYLVPRISEEPSESGSRNKRLNLVTRETDNIKRCCGTSRKKQKLNLAVEAKGVDDYFTPPRRDEGCKTYDCGNNLSKFKGTKQSEDGYICAKEFTVEGTDQAENMSVPTTFEVTLKAYNLEKCILNVATGFSRQNIPHYTSHIKLVDADENEWVVRVTHHLRKQCSLTKGWILFARDKKLMVGDVCVFERIGGREVKLKVNIYRSAGKYEVNLNDKLVKDTSRNDGSDASPTEFIKERTIEAVNKFPPSSFWVPSYFTPLLEFNSARLIKLVDADNNEWAVRYIYRPPPKPMP